MESSRAALPVVNALLEETLRLQVTGDVTIQVSALGNRSGPSLQHSRSRPVSISPIRVSLSTSFGFLRLIPKYRQKVIAM